MLCRARSTLLALLAVLGAGEMIAACGQKGDLYLVEDKQATPQKMWTPEYEAKPATETGEEGEVEADIEAAARVRGGAP